MYTTYVGGFGEFLRQKIVIFRLRSLATPPLIFMVAYVCETY